MSFRGFSVGCFHKTLENSYFLKPTSSSFDFHHVALAKPGHFSSGFCLKNGFWNHSLSRGRSSLSSCTQKVSEDGDTAVKIGKTLPWLASQRTKGTTRVEKVTNLKASRSSWEESAEKFLKSGTSNVENGGSTLVDRQGYTDGAQQVVEEEEGENEVLDDPRWDKIKNRYNRFVDAKPRFERPEFRQMGDRQESWGRKTWKEATESTVPRMVGEGIYGVGPVLAALSAGRREFYALYVQEGLDLSGNNRKKKDKKGFERVLRIAEKIALSKKEVSKHDLNMVVDSRPHQGLVLDASPLDMVGIKELDPVPMGQEKVPLWVALDEVTDPQNLGAIIRSSYFFGVSGVVLCAKNSAPLSFG